MPQQKARVCASVLPLGRTAPRVPACSLSLSATPGYRRHRRPTPGIQVFVGPLSGTEHPPGMPAPSPPSLLCESEHLNPNLSYLAICNRI